MSKSSGHWLDRYASGYHEWRHTIEPDLFVYERPLGLVETGFHIDGCHFGGRADFHANLRLNLKTNVSEKSLKRHITLAWTTLRLQHVLLLATVVESSRPSHDDLAFRVCIPRTVEGALDRGETDVTFVSRGDEAINVQEFRRDSISSRRLLDHRKTLSRLLVLGIDDVNSNQGSLDFLLYASHGLADGLTMYGWLSAFQALLNKSSKELLSAIELAVTNIESTRSILPPPQEDVYLRVPGNSARQRWFWLVMRIMRHLRKSKPAGFINPLRHKVRPKPSLPTSGKFSSYLDYSETDRPPLESGIAAVRLSKAATARLFSLCRRSGASIGAGGFVLLSMVMMKLYEEQSPDMALDDRQPFVGSFPLNPRPFLNYDGPYDSCMLAFSEGVVIPFLPSNLDLERRFRVLVKTANRELRSYQKKEREAVNAFDAHSPLRLQASTYLMLYEGIDKRLPPHLQKGITSIQGEYKVPQLWGRATCGVSSLGKIGHLFAPKAECQTIREGKEVAADFESLTVGVRARENEFLVGMRTSYDDRLEISVSYDATAMDAVQVERWRGLMESLLEP